MRGALTGALKIPMNYTTHGPAESDASALLRGHTDIMYYHILYCNIL